MVKKDVECLFDIFFAIEISYSKERNDVIFSNGLQEARSSCQGLKSCTHCGEEGANHNDPGRGPRQCANHQVFIDGISEPRKDTQEHMRHNMLVSI